MLRRILTLVISLLFILFAGVQYNDPDGWLWIPIYLIPAIIYGLLFFRKRFTRMTKILAIIFSLSLLIYIPDLWNWASSGFPSLVEEMQATKSHIEFMREFFGLMIVAFSFWGYPFFCRDVSD